MRDEIADALGRQWHTQRIGGGVIAGTAVSLHLSFAAASAARYSDAEVNDYATSRRYVWRPPLRLSVRARASHPAARSSASEARQPFLMGTAGFGFWNAPFLMAKRIGRLPEAIWFLSTSPPNQICLVPGVPGYGWKAQVVHAHRLGALAAGIPTLATVAWARASGRQRPAARWIQRLSGAHEALLETDLTSWHAYTVEWKEEVATFFVDDELVCRAPHPPRGPLGFVAWIDNQFVVATPRGEFRSGVLDAGPQWLELADLAITPLA